MKLWKKISLLTAVVLFLAMGIFGGGMLYETWKYNLNQTVSSIKCAVCQSLFLFTQSIAKSCKLFQRQGFAADTGRYAQCFDGCCHLFFTEMQLRRVYQSVLQRFSPLVERGTD